jgi:hypothetical protein
MRARVVNACWRFKQELRHVSATKPQALANELAKKKPPRGSAAVHPVIKRCYFFSPPALPPTLAPPLPPDGVAFPPPCIFAPPPDCTSAPPRPVVLRTPLLL